MKCPSMVNTRKHESISRSIDKKIKTAKPLARKSSNKILIEPVLSSAKPQAVPCNNPKKYLMKVYSSTASLNTSTVRTKKQKRMGKKLLKLVPIVKQILLHLEVPVIVKKIVQLSRASRTQQFRNNIDKVLRLKAVQGFCENSRIASWLYKTKIHKILTFNEPKFFM